MQSWFEPKFDALPAAQREIWPLLVPSKELSLVLYGGTAVALHRGHRTSFDFFTSEKLRKDKIESAFAFAREAETTQEAENTLVLAVRCHPAPLRYRFLAA